MSRLLAALLLALPVAAVQATEVVDDFENGNPNQWGFINNSGVVGSINPEGGNPGAWADSTEPYRSDHPNFTSWPPAGSELAAALASGTLHSLSLDFERVESSCFPGYDLPSAMSVQLVDTHSDPGGAWITAHTLDGPAMPTAAAPWNRVSFTIPSESTDATPANWQIDAPPELNYTWQDMMHNTDLISVFAINPSDITYDACWHLGVDNVVVTYGDAPDDVFVSGFENASR